MSDTARRALNIAKQFVDEGRVDDALYVLEPLCLEVEWRAGYEVPPALSTAETASRRPLAEHRRGERTPKGGRR